MVNILSNLDHRVNSPKDLYEAVMLGTLSAICCELLYLLISSIRICWLDWVNLSDLHQIWQDKIARQTKTQKSPRQYTFLPSFNTHVPVAKIEIKLSVQSEWVYQGLYSKKKQMIILERWTKPHKRWQALALGTKTLQTCHL